MEDLISLVASQDIATINFKLLNNQLSDLSPAFLAGMLVSEQFNPDLITQTLTCLLSIATRATTPDVRLFCVLKFIHLLTPFDEQDHAHLVHSIGALLVQLGQLYQHPMPREFQAQVDHALNDLINELNRKFRITKLPLYIGLMSKFINFKYRIGMYDMTDEDLRCLLSLESQDVRTIGKLLTRACEIANRYTNTTAADTLRIQIYEALMYVINNLNQPKNDEFKQKLMDPLENYVLQYCQLFTDRQRRQLLDGYNKICKALQRPISEPLKKKLREMPIYALKPKEKVPTEGNKVIFIAELKEWRKENYHKIKQNEYVDMNDIISFVNVLKTRYESTQIADVIVSLISKEQPLPVNVQLWKLMSKAIKQGQLFDRQKSKEINDSLDRLIQNTENRPFKSEPIEDLKLVEILTSLRPNYQVTSNFENTLNFVVLSLKEIYPTADIVQFGSFATGLYTSTSDLNVTILTEAPVRDVLMNVHNHMSSKPGSSQFISKGKLVQVKYAWETGLLVIITVANHLGVKNSQIIAEYLSRDRRAEVICRTIRQWAKNREIADPSRGFLSLYTWTVMVLSYLQRWHPPVLPRLQQGDHHPETVFGFDVWFDRQSWFRSDNSQTLQELISGFFRDYGQVLPTSQNLMISLRKGQVLEVAPHSFLYNIQDFFEDKNLAAAVKRDESRARDILAWLNEAMEALEKSGSFMMLIN